MASLAKTITFGNGSLPLPSSTPFFIFAKASRQGCHGQQPASQVGQVVQVRQEGQVGHVGQVGKKGQVG